MQIVEVSMNSGELSNLAKIVVSVFEEKEKVSEGKKIVVNVVVSRVASWYEKLRNVMDYREDEVILRASIERILKRRILLGGIGKTIAEPLVRELVWARYFPNESLPESIIPQVEKTIDLHLELRRQLLIKKALGDRTINDWILHMLSASIEKLLNPNREKEVMVNFMYQIIRQNITIEDDTKQTRDVQVLIAVRRSFARDDLAFLRYHLMQQYFGKLSEANVSEYASSFRKAYDEIEYQLNYVRKETINAFIKKKVAVFYILDALLRNLRGEFRYLLQNEEALRNAVYQVCDKKYEGVTSRVRRAIVRSVFFILLTKVIFAFAVEGTFEKFFYGRVLWGSLILNTTIPPLLMILIGFTIRAPGRSNSEAIYQHIKRVLFEESPRLGDSLTTSKKPKKQNSLLYLIFSILWVLAFVVSFGIVIFVLSKLNFTIISQAIFLFFLAIVSFLSYRIALIPRVYTVGEKESLLTPIVDFFFMPIVRVGHELTEGIQQINIILFVFDFIIEAPFKGLFAFFEQWFHFLHAKREELG